MSDSNLTLINEENLKSRIQAMYADPREISATLARYSVDSAEYKAAVALQTVGVPNPASGVDIFMEQIYLRGMLTTPDTMIPQVRYNFPPDTRLGRLLTAIEHSKKRFEGLPSAAVDQPVIPPYQELPKVVIASVPREPSIKPKLRPNPRIEIETKEVPAQTDHAAAAPTEPHDIVNNAIRAQAEAAEIADPKARKKALDDLAYDTYEKLLDASGTNAEQLANNMDTKISAKTFRYWKEQRLMGYDSLIRVVDQLASRFVPGDEAVAQKAANIMMGLPWMEPKDYTERMRYAASHGQSAKEFMDIFRYQERANVEKAWQEANKTTSREYDAVTAFRTYLAQGLPEGEELSSSQLAGFRSKKDAPNTTIINHSAKRMGAKGDDEIALFRKLVYEYPINKDLSKSQRAIDAAFAALETAGKDKVKRATAFQEMEQALMYRDGLRSKGERLIREELAEAICNHASANELLPPDMDAKKIKNALAGLASGGGETTMDKAMLITAYIFRDNQAMYDRCVDAYAPSHFVETVAGEGNRFRSGETPHRPAWSHAATMEAWKRKKAEAAPIESALEVGALSRPEDIVSPIAAIPTAVAVHAVPEPNLPVAAANAKHDQSDRLKPEPISPAASDTVRDEAPPTQIIDRVRPSAPSSKIVPASKEDHRTRGLAILARLSLSTDDRERSDALRYLRLGLEDSSLDTMAERLRLEDYKQYKKMEDRGRLPEVSAAYAVAAYEIPDQETRGGQNYRQMFLEHCIEKPRVVAASAKARTAVSKSEGPNQLALLLLESAIKTGVRQSQALKALRASLSKDVSSRSAVAEQFGMTESAYEACEENGKLPADKIEIAIHVFGIPERLQEGFKQRFDESYRHAGSSRSDPMQPPRRWQDRSSSSDGGSLPDF